MMFSAPSSIKSGSIEMSMSTSMSMSASMKPSNTGLLQTGAASRTKFCAGVINVRLLWLCLFLIDLGN
jgi:hypothetical protein